jgi:DNA-binding response OmpR family regulator
MMTGMPAVLLAEDDELVAYVVADVLGEAGFAVVLAHSGDHALAELQSDPTRFSAVVTDIRLGPGPDGWEIGRRARATTSEMPVVYISGDSSRDWKMKGVPGSIMLAKPFPPDRLVTVVSKLIGQGGSTC